MNINLSSFNINCLSTIFDNPGASDNLANVIVEFILIILALGVVNFFVDFFIKRKFVIVGVASLSAAYIISYIFEFTSFTYILLGGLLILVLISMFVNLAEIRSLFANKFSQKRNDRGLNKKNSNVEKIYDHENLYKTINDTVQYLSKNKIGAIMTFERKDKLEGIIKNGTILNAPVTYELLITIFYPGTRLHDGAVVIKNDIIVAASVYYTPTTKPLIGKYGSRHRAAIGISEICDAVTVVVSEETGRISIAYNGELESYAPDLFAKAFENIMAETDVMSADNELPGEEIDGQ